ncbi:MAG: alkaline phosphatase family protein [Pseudomonadota bacterium]
MDCRNNNRILVIGLDGVSFENLAPLFAVNQLPNLTKLIKSGLSSPLRSVYPPMTPAAWPSFSTGKNPGKHGVYGWWELACTKSGLKVVPTSSASIKEKTFWQILSENGYKVGLMNVPMTFPATEVNGFIICGFDNPFESVDSSPSLSYPPDIISTLRNNNINYEVMELIESDLPLSYSMLLKYLNKWISIEEERTKAAIWLRKKYSPDYMMVVYHIADYFMHRARHDSKVVRNALIELDKNVGRLISECDENTTILVVSDHGSTELKKYIFFQNWLVEKKLLSFKNIASSENLDLIIKNTINRNIENITHKEVTDLSGFLNDVWNNLPHNVKELITEELQKKFPTCCASDNNIDWGKSMVFSISSYGELYINQKGKFPHGIVNPGSEYTELTNYLINELSKLKDPETRELILKRVVRKEDYYHGKQLNNAPDILCFLRDPSYYFMRFSHYMRPETHIRSLKLSGSVIIEPITTEDDFLGDHTPTGIFIASGKILKQKGQKLPANLTDIAPTILALFGVPVPSDMDGQVLNEWFNLPENQPVYEPTEENTRDEIKLSPYNIESDNLLRKKLNFMGYNI